MTTTKPSVTKAFQELISPELNMDGFIKINNKLFLRLLDNEVMQWISLYVETGLKREYRIEYGTSLISIPSSSFCMNIGGNFTKLSSGGTYGAKTEKMLDKSIQRVLIAYREEVRPILFSTSSIKSFILAYENLKNENPHLYNVGHADFYIACAHTILGDYEQAKIHSLLSIEKFTNKVIYFEQKELKTSWPSEKIQIVKELLNAIDNMQSNMLLNSWRKYTVDQLKLSKLTKT